MFLGHVPRAVGTLLTYHDEHDRQGTHRRLADLVAKTLTKADGSHASPFALHVRSGESPQELRTQALAEIDRCEHIDATFQPNTQVFAPRFIMLYKTDDGIVHRERDAIRKKEIDRPS